MVDVKRAVGSYILELLAGAAIILGILIVVSSVVQRDLLWGLLGAALVAGGTVVFKRPGRDRRAKNAS